MWDNVSDLAGLIVFVVLLNILWLAFDIPEWLEKVLRRRGNRSRIEARIEALERKILDLEHKVSKFD